MRNSQKLGIAVLLVLGCTGIALAATKYFSYSTTVPALTEGVFYSNGSGNAGTGNFSRVYLEDNLLKGTIILQSVGEATFDAGAKIIPPSAGKVISTWRLEGTVTSQNAGTIKLSGANTDACFDPVSQRLQGYGWNEGLGRVYLGAEGCGSSACNPSVDPSCIADEGAGFIGRVKILGAAGGDNTLFDVLYSVGEKINASVLNNTIQNIRKNVGLLSRNISNSAKNKFFTTTENTGDKIFYINDSNTSSILELANLQTDIFVNKKVRSVIVVGGDVFISADITLSSSSPRVIIALKNSAGVGGNIYIAGDVKKIQSSLVAEGSLYSGTKATNATNLYNDTAEKVTKLPQNQLWIYGSLMSRNTIGGSAKSGNVVCPYTEQNCDTNTAIKYDLNYFRDYRIPKPPTPNTFRAYKDATLDNFSVIIEHDTRIHGNPPPGLEQIQ